MVGRINGTNPLQPPRPAATATGAKPAPAKAGTLTAEDKAFVHQTMQSKYKRDLIYNSPPDVQALVQRYTTPEYKFAPHAVHRDPNDPDYAGGANATKMGVIKWTPDNPKAKADMNEVKRFVRAAILDDSGYNADLWAQADHVGKGDPRANALIRAALKANETVPEDLFIPDQLRELTIAKPPAVKPKVQHLEFDVLVDTSSSMGTPQQAFVNGFVRSAAQSLNAQDAIDVDSFSDGLSADQPAAPAPAYQGYRAPSGGGSGTNLVGSLLEKLKNMPEEPSKGTGRALAVVTDGAAALPAEMLNAIYAEARRKDVRLVFVGTPMLANDTRQTLSKLADLTGGSIIENKTPRAAFQQIADLYTLKR